MHISAKLLDANKTSVFVYIIRCLRQEGYSQAVLEIDMACQFIGCLNQKLLLCTQKFLTRCKRGIHISKDLDTSNLLENSDPLIDLFPRIKESSGRPRKSSMHFFLKYILNILSHQYITSLISVKIYN